jgi:spermidine/putrescine transport system substrate-binding protein
VARDELRILMSSAAAHRMGRRDFLGVGAAGAAALALAACGGGGGSSSSSSSHKGADGKQLESALNIFSWAEYQAPDTIKQYTRDTGAKVKLDIFASNEEALAKLELAGGAGYDIVAPTGAFIPLFLQKNLLMPLDKSKIPNFKNIDEKFLNQKWDPGNKYSAVKDWGATGFVYDSNVIKSSPKTWADFFALLKQPDVSGKVSILDAPGELTGLVFWRDGIDWNTTKKEDLDHAEQVLLTEVAPHIKAFDSYPSAAMLEGSYVLSQAWNGDARVAVIDDPARYKWMLGAPKTELFTDTWVILAKTQHPEAAHAWINNILEPKVSAGELKYHGYNTAVKGMDPYLKDAEQRQIIFFNAQELSQLVDGEVTSAQDRTVEIANKVKAAAGK